MPDASRPHDARMLGTIAFALLALPGFPTPPTTAADDGGTRVVLDVRVPVTTPIEGPVWVSGDLPPLGSWNGAGVRLAKAGERRWLASLDLPPATRFEFKLTRGSWDTVEKDAQGGELANRVATSGPPGATDTLHLEVVRWRDGTGGTSANTRPSTITGDVRRHPAFASAFVAARDVLVWLPPGYDAHPGARYPVLYFHDGQNVLDAATSFIGVEWGADETATRLIGSGALPPFIIVAVANSPARIADYTPARDESGNGGRLEDYGRFLMHELKPFIDRTYRTRTDPASTGLVGSSLGGVASLALAMAHPDTFGLVGCVSPSMWFARRDLLRRAAAMAPRGLRIWLDVGTEEGRSATGAAEAVADTRALHEALLARGYQDDVDLRFEVVEGARHDERAWAARLDRLLLFLLAPAASGNPAGH